MDAFEQFVRGGLARLELPLDDVELEIMRFADGLYGAELAELLKADLAGVWPELRLDLSKAPES